MFDPVIRSEIDYRAARVAESARPARRVRRTRSTRPAGRLGTRARAL